MQGLHLRLELPLAGEQALVLHRLVRQLLKHVAQLLQQGDNSTILILNMPKFALKLTNHMHAVWFI